MTLSLVFVAALAVQQSPLVDLPGAPAAPRPPADSAAPLVYSGRDNNTAVRLPRFETPVTVDGELDEPQWAGAARLTGFSQFNPSDGRPALDSTVALVWYGPDAIYFAVRAYAPPGTVRGTLADRDRIQNDDHVQFILDTFNDRRQAFVFAVNPLGVQSDGIRTEGGGGGGRGGRGGGGGGGGMMGGGFSRANLGNADLNQDMIWQSRGRITAWGYQVELRVPFKSIRYRVRGTMQWGLNVVRNTQRNNY
ncbi:MAG: carbohydrate binding family 9 domain-containing protein, partial [Gemmatimonadetes bacterium]|nr:carbohydrate binding family 9 domain-containing protein [Gemmatimonadota bacterium]